MFREFMKLLKPTEASIKGNLEEINARVGQILGPDHWGGLCWDYL